MGGCYNQNKTSPQSLFFLLIGPGELGILDMNITGRVEDKVLGDTMSPYPHQLEGDQNLPSPSAFSRVTPTSIMSAVMRGGDREGNNLLVDMSNAQKPTDISLSETLGNSMLPTGTCIITCTCTSIITHVHVSCTCTCSIV